MEPNLYDKIDALTDQMNKNHVAVCERLTALETKYEVSRTNFARGITLLGTMLTIVINVFLGIFRRH